MEQTLHDPTFWVLIAFITLFLVLIYLKVPKAIAKQLDDRSQQIETNIRDAEKLREDAQELLANYEKKQKESVNEIENIISSAQIEVERMRKQATERLKQTLSRREKIAMDRISQLEAQALIEVSNLAASIAIDATQDLIQKNIELKGDFIVDDAIKGLEKELS